MKIEGKVHEIRPTVSLKNGNSRQDVILHTGGKYNQVYCIEFYSEKINMIDQIEIGDDVAIDCNLRGNEWTRPDGVKKYFLSLTAWQFAEQE